MSAPSEAPVVAPGYDSESVTRKITDVVLARPLKRGRLDPQEPQQVVVFTAPPASSAV